MFILFILEVDASVLIVGSTHRLKNLFFCVSFSPPREVRILNQVWVPPRRTAASLVSLTQDVSGRRHPPPAREGNSSSSVSGVALCELFKNYDSVRAYIISQNACLLLCGRVIVVGADERLAFRSVAAATAATPRVTLRDVSWE